MIPSLERTSSGSSDSLTSSPFEHVNVNSPIPFEVAQEKAANSFRWCKIWIFLMAMVKSKKAMNDSVIVPLQDSALNTSPTSFAQQILPSGRNSPPHFQREIESTTKVVRPKPRKPSPSFAQQIIPEDPCAFLITYESFMTTPLGYGDKSGR